MPGRRRGTQERMRDYRQISRLYLRGKTQYEIADELRISQATVCRDLKAITKLWEKAVANDFVKHRARELATINELERTYWEAWEASKTTTTVRGASDADSATVTQKEGAGNSAFLAGVERCVRLRMDLIGTNAPRFVGIVDEDFDQEKWANTRDARHARALALLDEIENDDGEDQ